MKKRLISQIQGGLYEAKQADPVTVKNFHLFPKAQTWGLNEKQTSQAASSPHLHLRVT